MHALQLTLRAHEIRCRGERARAMKLERPLHICLSMLVAIGMLAPIAWSGLYTDDTMHGHMRGLVAEIGTSLPDFIYDSSVAWMRRQGRIFPVGLALISTSFYYLGPD